ncbi:CU044_2847 family protein [Streptomyces sp. NPDC090442]|uniref:CU044_2847 family protein n=1 Tax=Streptomyces sp. NPDC090442 TaxID=3365962 RepID=UPI00382AB64D
MPNHAELTLADGTSIRLELAPAQGAPGPPGPPETTEAAFLGLGKAPVAAALRTTLHPLGQLLQEIHDAVTTAERLPPEMSVQFGVQIGQDLKLGIVGANGRASLTVTATWRPQQAE